jgi:hypothetical protein
MPIEINKHSTCITGDSIDFYRMLTLKQGLRLEIVGMRMTRGRTCYSIIKEEYGLKGNKRRVFAQFEELCQEASALQERINNFNEGATS